jgi:hypothetical protein
VVTANLLVLQPPRQAGAKCCSASLDAHAVVFLVLTLSMVTFSLGTPPPAE